MNNDKLALLIYWNYCEYIALSLYQKFGYDFTEPKIYRIRFTELLNGIGFAQL